MNWKLLVCRLAVVFLMTAPFFLYRESSEAEASLSARLENLFDTGEDEEDEEDEAEFSEERMRHQFNMLRNPVTGRIPKNIHQLEVQVARNIPDRQASRLPGLSGIQGTNTQNNYTSAGPDNIAGRSRTLEFDRRNPKIMITGGTTGGIFRSTDGGQNWQFVSPEDDIRSSTSLVQDPTKPNEWYCGTGEVFYSGSQADIAGTVGYGIFKSTDNGATWSKLSGTAANDPDLFDNNFDLVHRLAVHPLTGHVYAAIHNRIIRSTDGGRNWQVVLRSTADAFALEGITDIFIPDTGTKIYAAFSGENPDRAIVGVWESESGDEQATTNAWKRIAGGERGQADSVNGWKAYPNWGRVVLTTNAAATQLFVLYKNGQSSDQGQPEADLFRANTTAALPNSGAWTNLNAWVPNEPGYDEPGIDPYTTQFNGFNMSLKVKPDNDNVLFVGGTNIHRVHLNETAPARKFRRIGGYGRGFFPNDVFFYPNHHPDIHGIYYKPGNNNTLLTVSDGGIHQSTNGDMADTVRWEALVNNLQTAQYQFISLLPDPFGDWIIGGTQDNGTLYNLDAPGGRNHSQIGSGDGASAFMSRFTKNGNTWEQAWYFSFSRGALLRSNFTWRFENNALERVTNNLNTITPNGLSDEGPWLTVFLMDPDSSEHVYYTSRNRVYRTRNGSTVTSFAGWTELSGVRTTLPSDHIISANAISKLSTSGKYLFLGTDKGRLYRLDSANLTAPGRRPANITPSNMAGGGYVSGIAVNPRNPDTVLVTVSNYDDGGNVVRNVFWSGNATGSNPVWQTIDGQLEPLSAQSCAIVVKTNGVEYYVGTSAGLYSTTAIRGENTQWLQEGSGMMKTAIVRSLYNRPEDNALLVGTHGNGAFFTRIGNAIIYDENAPPPVPVTDQFITAVYPTLTSSTPVFYQVGNAPVSEIRLEVFNSVGQLLHQEDRAYASDFLFADRYAAGVYFLRITSSDGRYKHVQKFVKQ